MAFRNPAKSPFIGRLLLSCLAFTLLTPNETRADEAVWKKLFNEVDLAGWVFVNTPPSTWSVKDGMLICTGKPIGEIRTEKMYQNFVLEVEWRHMVPKGNAGIFVWADDITARGVPFHRGIEVQVLENAYGNTQSHTTHGDIFPIHGAKMIPVNGRGGDRAFPTEERAKSSPEWNHYRVECVDGKISLSVNGKLVTQGAECNPRKGYICLESEGGVVHYRNLRIQELPDTPIDANLIAIADRGLHSIYNGLDLSGWKTESPDFWKSNDWTMVYTGPDEREVGIEYDARLKEFDFLIDFRLIGDRSKLRVDPTPGKVSFNTTADKSRSALAKQNGWNRLEGSVRNGKWVAKVNGQEVLSESVGDGETSLKLFPSGKVEFANLYLK